MKTTEAVRAITKVYNTIRAIDSARDLQREHLTLAEYHAARDIFAELSTPGSTADTLQEAVAALYKRAGFTVKNTAIGYRITTA